MNHLWRLMFLVLLLVGNATHAAETCVPANYPFTPRSTAAGMQYGTWVCGYNGRPATACGWTYNNGTASSPVTVYDGMCTMQNPPTQCEGGRERDAYGVCKCKAGTFEPPSGVGACLLTDPRNADRDACAAFGISQTLPGGALVQDYRLQGNIADGSQYCMPGAFGSDSKGCKVSFSRDAFLDYGGGASVTEGTFSMASDASTVDQSCAIGTGNTPSVPQKEKCANGYTGTVNGVEVCVNKVPDSGVGNNSDEETTDNETETKTVKRNSTTECKDGVCTTITTTTTTVTTKADGVTTTSTSTTTTTGTKAAFCKENPTTKVCSNGDQEGVGNVGSVGSGKTHGQPDLYETKYPEGIKGVWEDSGIAGADGKFGQLASALMPGILDGNGACLSFIVPLSVGIVDFGSLDVSPPCIIWPFIRICVLITALWLARALIFGG